MKKILNIILISIASLAFVVICGHNIISDFLCNILSCNEDITYGILTFGISVFILGYNINIISKINLFLIIGINLLLLILPDYGDYILPGRRESMLVVNFIFLILYTFMFLKRRYLKNNA